MMMSDEKEKLPFWQKGWLMWLCLVFVPPIGMILCYVNREKYPKWKYICGIGLVWFIICLAQPGTVKKDTQSTQQAQTASVEKAQIQTATLEEQQAAFNQFYKEFTGIDTEFNENWKKLWGATVEGMGNGTVNQYQAYDAFKTLRQLGHTYGDKLRSVGVSNKIPPATRKAIEEARDEYAEAISLRGYGASQMADIVNEGKYKPSDVNDAKATIDMATQKGLAAMAKMVGAIQEAGYNLPK